MENLKLSVKDKSVNHFFSENQIGFVKDMRQGCGEEANPYYYMKDKIYLKRSLGLKVGSKAVFELSDTSRMSNKELVNTYTYTIFDYDSVSYELRLTDFKIYVGGSDI